VYPATGINKFVENEKTGPVCSSILLASLWKRRGKPEIRSKVEALGKIKPASRFPSH
jgi:hypothetical protein